MSIKDPFYVRHATKDQIEQQEECHQQNTEGNDTWKNKLENLTEKFYGMDEKMNTLTNLIQDIAAQAKEDKLKYESVSSDSKGKEKARTYVEGQIPRPLPMIIQQKLWPGNRGKWKYIHLYLCLKFYGINDQEEENEDDISTIPDASIFRR